MTFVGIGTILATHLSPVTAIEDSVRNGLYLVVVAALRRFLVHVGKHGDEDEILTIDGVELCRRMFGRGAELAPGGGEELQQDVMVEVLAFLDLCRLGRGLLLGVGERDGKVG